MDNASKLGIGFLLALSVLALLHWSLAIIAAAHAIASVYNMRRGHCWYNWSIAYAGFSVAHCGVTKDRVDIATLQFALPKWMAWIYNSLCGRWRDPYKCYKSFSLITLPRNALRHTDVVS